VLDDTTRENEGDLIISAAHLTASTCAFLVRHTSGYLCAPLSAARAARLELPFMVAASANTDPNRTAYCVTVDAVGRGVTTGIGAADRAATANALAAADAVAADFRRPGHVVPLVARAGGVRERRGHTEAGWEFARLAGIQPEVAVIGEMVEDGEVEVVGGGDGAGAGGRHAEGAKGRGRPGYRDAGMMRAEGCLAFGRNWGIKCCTIEDLVLHVEATEGKLGNGASA